MADFLFFLKAFIGLFVLVNPLEGIPFYLSASRQMGPGMPGELARRASGAVFLILLLSAMLGNGILRLFGVGIGAFQTGGGAILFLIAVKMVFGSMDSAFAKTSDKGIGLESAIVPLAIPLMAGPGAITGAILYGTRVHSVVEVGILAGIILIVGLATYGSLRAAELLSRGLKDTGVTVATSMMGLVIAAMAAEMIGSGIALMFGLPPVGSIHRRP